MGPLKLRVHGLCTIAKRHCALDNDDIQPLSPCIGEKLRKFVSKSLTGLIPFKANSHSKILWILRLPTYVHLQSFNIHKHLSSSGLWGDGDGNTIGYTLLIRVNGKVGVRLIKTHIIHIKIEMAGTIVQTYCLLFNNFANYLVFIWIKLSVDNTICILHNIGSLQSRCLLIWTKTITTKHSCKNWNTVNCLMIVPLKFH